jgi:hypothetical protein
VKERVDSLKGAERRKSEWDEEADVEGKILTSGTKD